MTTTELLGIINRCIRITYDDSINEFIQVSNTDESHVYLMWNKEIDRLRKLSKITGIKNNTNVITFNESDIYFQITNNKLLFSYQNIWSDIERVLPVKQDIKVNKYIKKLLLGTKYEMFDIEQSTFLFGDGIEIII